MSAYVDSFLVNVEREHDGWPKGVTPEQKKWLAEKINLFYEQTNHKPIVFWILSDWIMRQPGAPGNWVVRDYINAAVHRAMLYAGFEEVWQRRG